MKFKKIILNFLPLLFLGGIVTYAAAPIGGYLPNMTLDPSCAPGETDCFVQITWWSPWYGTDNMQEATDNAEDMYVVGNVGIWEIDPSTKLHVNDADILNDVEATIGNDFDLVNLGLDNPDTNTYSIKRNNTLRVESEQQRTNIDFWLQSYSELSWHALIFNTIQKGTVWLSGSGFRARISDGVSKFGESEWAFLKYSNLPHIPSFYSDSVLLRNRVAGNYVNGLSLQANGDIRFVQWPNPSDIHVSMILHEKKLWLWLLDPQAELDVAGNIKISENNTVCDADHAGEIRFDGGNFFGCDGILWKQLDN